jgi:hypothetical protein
MQQINMQAAAALVSLHLELTEVQVKLEKLALSSS